MDNDVQRYLDLIGEHLHEHHAALLVGAGFSRNAEKIDDSIPNSPTWSELAETFIGKLSSDPVEQEDLKKLSPLVLAEQVEAIYGRPELDHLLLSNIRDADFLPSDLYHKLLSLPWSDIFTTNYDTLLERASDEITEKSFMAVTGKDDLIGSFGTTRIVKLHGSFPSHRPFIITSEDYRTYPQKFAPFVNTVQQSLLENTLCLIGFSGNDPNFEKWIGWIRDNLGEDNSPNIYLLLHHEPSGAERELMRRRKIIPVDLSKFAPNKPTVAIYEAALDYLLKCQRSTLPANWDLTCSLHDEQGHPLPIENATVILREIRESYPGWITVPPSRLSYLRYVKSNAERVLAAYCATNQSASDEELEFLYEYDWIREKALLPPSFSDLKLYHKILDRHPESHVMHKLSIQLSILRDLRESGDWTEWEVLRSELCAGEAYLDNEQRQQLQWEECLCALSRYQFQELKTRLEHWKVKPDMSLWALRKASLLAEYGEFDIAQALLQQAILNIRHRLSHQRQVNLNLLSLESSLMYLQGYISQALETDNRPSQKDGGQTAAEVVDAQHQGVHAQYHVSWENQNSFFTSRLETVWTPFQVHTDHATFDFGKKRQSSHFGADEELISAYSFLRFREETGIPFHLNSVYSDKKAACGAAERIALYTPFWSILTLVRADAPKAVASTITRGVLSGWTQEEADQCCQFYLEGILRTEPELRPADWFYRRGFARLAADVLPEVLSELCSKCSPPILDEIFYLLKKLYNSEKKLCYQQTSSITKRLLTAYPPEKQRALIPQLLRFPIETGGDNADSCYFPDPLEYFPTTDDYAKQSAEQSLPEIEELFTQCQQDDQKQLAMSHLLYCLCYGLLTDGQKLALRDLLWEGHQLQVPKNWLRTICLKLPPPHNINLPQYLGEVMTKSVEGYSGHGERPDNDYTIHYEIRAAALSGGDAFSDKQISSIISCFSARLDSLSQNLSDGFAFMGIQEVTRSQLYEIAHTLWILTASKSNWVPSDMDRQAMIDILEIYDNQVICHYGLRSAWCRMLRMSHDTKDLANYLRSVDEECSRWGYVVLAADIKYPQTSLLTEEERGIGIASMTQQIVWGVPKQLTAALQVAKIVVEYRPGLISDEILELLLIGLSQLKQQTAINTDDTVASASGKGDLRINAASLAKSMRQAELHGNKPEVLDEWMAVINDENEFAEVRNA